MSEHEQKPERDSTNLAQASIIMRAAQATNYQRRRAEVCDGEACLV